MDHVVKTSTLAATAALSALLLLYANGAKAQIIFSCPFGGHGGGFLDRGFYIRSYPGANLGTAMLAYCSLAPGSGSAFLTARLGAYDGPIIGRTARASFHLSGSGDSRIDSIEVHATDASGNQSEVQTVTVTVPKSPDSGM